MSMRLLVVMLFYSLPSLVEAAIIYVDRDAKCGGNGQSITPYCSIQLAFNNVVAGDTIRIRNSASPYDERALLTRSGKSWAPIIVEPDLGHNPRIRYSGR